MSVSYSESKVINLGERRHGDEIEAKDLEAYWKVES